MCTRVMWGVTQRAKELLAQVALSVMSMQVGVNRSNSTFTWAPILQTLTHVLNLTNVSNPIDHNRVAQVLKGKRVCL